MRLVALALLVTVGLAFRGAPEPARAQSTRAPRTPIQHFLVLLQQGRSFDHYFGTYPGADGTPSDTCLPVDLANPSTDCARPRALGPSVVTAMPHDGKVLLAQHRGGRMDGFVDATRRQGDDNRQAMGFYDGRDLPYYWGLAHEFVLFDQFFASSMNGGVANRLTSMTGVATGIEDVPSSGLPSTLPTIFERLSQAGTSWKVYVEGYDSSVHYRTMSSAPRGLRGQVAALPLLGLERFVTDPGLSSHMVDLSEYAVDLENGSLPSVAYLIPTFSSEEAPASPRAGEALTRHLVTTLQRSRYWESSALLLTYDGSGGWFDHVPPAESDGARLGFRVPALLVSPFARRGAVDHTVLEHASILRFIEDNWGLQPLATRDANAGGIRAAFDFNAPARAPRFVDGERAPSEPASSPRVTLLGYGLTAAVALMIVGWGLGRGARVEALNA
ncbi:MAG: alkaline phosphatase family protein [Dehalococcoidia bacterium]